MGHPVGQHIKAACALAQAQGYCTGREYADKAGLDISNSFKYLSRAVGLGYLNVDRSHRPYKYFPVEGWQERIVAKRTHRPRRWRTKPSTPHPLQACWASAPAQ